MNFKKISAQVFVSEQISLEDLGRVAELGIKTVICNRPDNETAGQLDSASIAEAAGVLGISFVSIPVAMGEISDECVAEFKAAYSSANTPVLAYCRSGMRSTALWALAEATTLDLESILVTAQGAGYDLSGLRQRLEASTR